MYVLDNIWILLIWVSSDRSRNTTFQLSDPDTMTKYDNKHKEKGPVSMPTKNGRPTKAGHYPIFPNGKLLYP